jgi:hypothetical protein
MRHDFHHEEREGREGGIFLFVAFMLRWENLK